MRINADLYRFHAEGTDTVCLLLANQNSVGLQLDAESTHARVLQNLEEISAHQNLAAADGEIENSGVGHLVEKVLDFHRGHLAVIVMVEIAVETPLIAAIGQVQ